MPDFELNHKIDMKKLHTLTLGEHNIPELSNRLTQVFNKLTNKNDCLTYKDFFAYFCPKLNFAIIENLSNEYLNKLKSELVVMQILNSDKEEDYFQNVINGVFLKYIFAKTTKINEKIKARVDSMLENLNTLTETKKYTIPMKKQFYYLLKDNKKIQSHRKLETMNSNQTLDQEVITPFTYQNSYQNKHTELTDSNRTYYLEPNNNSHIYQESKKLPENLTIPNFYNTFTKNKYETVNYSNRNLNSENFSFYNNNIIQVNPNSTGNREKSDLSARKNLYSNVSINQANNERFNLTNDVWPKTRTLLSIGSKMYRENLITNEQRGMLKELILDKNQHLNMYLSLYEINNNYQVLYDNIIKLISQYSNIE